MTKRFLLSAAAVALLTCIPPVRTVAEEQAALRLAQQSPDPRQRQRQQQQPAPQPQRPAVHPQRPAPQPQRPVVQPQPQRPVVQPQPQRPVVQPQPQRPVVQPQPQRPVVQPQPQRPVVQPQPQRPVVQPQPQRPGVQPQAPAAQPLRPPGLQPAQRPAVQVQPAGRRIDDFRNFRRESREGNRTVIREPGRTIVREGNRTVIRHDEAARLRLRAPGARVERRGSDTYTFVDRPGGVRIINVVDANGRLVRRIRRDRNGREVVIINNRRRAAGAALGALAVVAIAAPVIAIARERYIVEAETAPPALLYETLTAPPVEPLERAYELDEIRDTPNLRDRMPRIDIDSITFDTGSWDVTPEEAAKLAPIAEAMRQAIERNPNEVFLIEGHTDLVGDETDNLSLSDRRAEAVAIVLSEQYGIPPENLTTQGYGESQPKIPTELAERRNRRVSVRRITPLLAGGTDRPPEEAPPTPGGG